MIIGIRTDPTIKPGNCFGVVIEHLRLRIEHGVESLFVTIEIRNQNFDFAFGIQGAYLPDCLGPMGGSAVLGDIQGLPEVMTVCARFKWRTASAT